VLSKQEVIELLERHGIMATQQRVELGRLLFARPQHISAEQLMESASHKAERQISKATIYNTLNLFAEKGLLREVIVDPTKTFYDSNLSRHGHVYNIDSGEISDIPMPAVLMSDLPADTTAVSIDIVVRVKNSC